MGTLWYFKLVLNEKKGNIMSEINKVDTMKTVVWSKKVKTNWVLLIRRVDRDVLIC